MAVVSPPTLAAHRCQVVFPDGTRIDEPDVQAVSARLAAEQAVRRHPREALTATSDIEVRVFTGPTPAGTFRVHVIPRFLLDVIEVG